MGLLNKLKAVLGLSKPPAKQASQNRSDKNRQGNGRRSARPGRGAPTRSRSAKPRNGNPGEGANAPDGARKPRNPQGNSERRPDRKSVV